MTMPLANDVELRGLIAALREGALSTAQAERLNGLLLSSPSARDVFARHALLQATLELAMGHSDQWSVVGGQCKGASDSPSSSISPIAIEPSPTLRPSLLTLHSPLGNFVFSHIAAAIILGIGLLIGLAWRISLPSSDGLTPKPPGNVVAIAVGRITALADCQWSKQGSGVRDQATEIPNPPISKFPTPQIPIFQGDRFHLVSGLMQITYDTGAKVLLEGPCTYEVDAVDGGYLAVGKLTALVKKKIAESNPQPLSPNPLFTVRTPTAIVTDLGTEFGVEVEKSGATRSHVFQGKVSLVPSPNGRGARSEGIVLSVGESAHIERGRNRKVVIIRERGQPNRFVRQIPNPKSQIPNHQITKSHYPLPITNYQLSYRLTDLGTLGGTRSRALAVNAAGHVVGEAATIDGVMHAFLYANGKMTDISAPTDGSSCANDINALGQVVGVRLREPTENNPLAFLYHNGAMRQIGTLGGFSSCAAAINDAGTIVGYSQNSNNVEHAFLYTDGKRMKDLGSLGGPQAWSGAGGINNNGLVMGCSETSNRRIHAFLHSRDAGMQDLGVLGGDSSMAHGINDADQVVGHSSTADGSVHAFISSGDAGLKDLGTLGGPRSLAQAINRQGQIVGKADGIDDRGVVYAHAFLYSGGKMIDLDALVGSATGWTRLEANDINNPSQIVGCGVAPDGNMRAFLLTPVKRQGTKD